MEALEGVTYPTCPKRVDLLTFLFPHVAPKADRCLFLGPEGPIESIESRSEPDGHSTPGLEKRAPDGLTRGVPGIS